MSVHKVLKNKELVYSHSRLKPVQEQDLPARPPPNCKRVECKLSISRGGFLYRESQLYNQLPVSLARTSSEPVFKKNEKTMDKREHSTSSSLKNALVWMNLYDIVKYID
jgi:hypothetical protein